MAKLTRRGREALKRLSHATEPEQEWDGYERMALRHLYKLGFVQTHYCNNDFTGWSITEAGRVALKENV